MNPRAAFLLFGLLFACLCPALAQINSLPEVDFSSLSQSDPNPLGSRALTMHPEEWKHGETEHFIYHFVHGYVATPISVEAEFYYRVIVKELERDPPGGDTKSHIYIFEKTEDWQAFQKLGHLEKWTGGLHSQGDLFVHRDPAYRFSSGLLGHEIAHLVLHRYYPDSIPRWLDEGFAEYVSKKAHASFKRARGYISRAHSQVIAPEKFIPLGELVTMDYPEDEEKVSTFYDEAQRLVRFLAATDQRSFLGFLDALSRHQPFPASLLSYYSGKFATVASFEDSFRDYATNEYAVNPSAESGE
ncbi:MAG: hypothetical protein M3Q46_14325 [Verrucomicrobiota bacterium]|nr:hypothetical protein [Verrucomicrobiota bacterium]